MGTVASYQFSHAFDQNNYCRANYGVYYYKHHIYCFTALLYTLKKGLKWPMKKRKFGMKMCCTKFINKPNATRSF